MHFIHIVLVFSGLLKSEIISQFKVMHSEFSNMEFEGLRLVVLVFVEIRLILYRF